MYCIAFEKIIDCGANKTLSSQIKKTFFTTMFTPQEATRIATEKFKILKETEFVNVMNEIERAANDGKFEVYFNSMYPETIERIKNNGWNLYQYPSGECKISWPKGAVD